MTKVRVRYAPSPTDIYTSEMPEQHCLTIYLHVITMANLLSVLRIRIKKKH